MIALMFPLALVSAVIQPIGPFPHTYSIVARDPKTGEMGVAVQSHYFSVGPIVPWAESGVGAVATQSLVLVDYGPRGLELMRKGMTAKEALDSLLKEDPNPDVRQVAMIDTKGNVTAHTGSKCIPDAGQHIGATYSCQANLMSNPKIWGAMAEAFEKAQGPLSERMMQALEAGEKAGGDIRGRQSAAMLIVKAQSSGKPWMDRLVDLRVEDSPDPLKELRRLLRLRMAYNKEDEGDNFIAAKNPSEALKSYAEAAQLAPEVVELQFWAAVSMFTEGQEEQALKLFHRVFEKESRWIDLVPRLAQVGLFPNDPEKIKKVQAQGTRARTATTSMGTKSTSVIKPNK